MTNKTELVSVPRELLERLISATKVARGEGSPTQRDAEALLAAPAEAVRAVVEEQDLFESVFPMPDHTTRFKGGYAATEFNAWAAHDFVKKWDGWKARAKFNPQRQVVLPERRNDLAHPDWNACLDEVEELNK